MKPEDDPWLKKVHTHAELLDREIKNLVSLTRPIRENRPVITKYQDFWNKAKHITTLFKEFKPLARSDRDILWKQFNALCLEVKEMQKTEYKTLEFLSQQHLEEIMKLADLGRLPPDARITEIHELVERRQALKTAGDTLGRFKHAMIAKHKKTCFDRIQEIRATHNAAWDSEKTGTPVLPPEAEHRIRKNLEANNERYRKAVSALENFQIGRNHILTFLATCDDPDKAAKAKIQLKETEARIMNIEDGIRKLGKWVAEDERFLKRK
jgi:hypothetical protein